MKKRIENLLEIFIYASIILIVELHCEKLYDTFENECTKFKEDKMTAKLNQKQNFQFLRIYTFNEYFWFENFDDTKNMILDGCRISDNWNLELSPLNLHKNIAKIYENEKIPRRSFRIEYMGKNNQLEIPNNDMNKELIVINSIELTSDIMNNLPVTKFPKLTTVDLPFLLKIGNSFDFFIEYNCSKTEYSKQWYTTTITITIEENYYVNFSFVKICTPEFKKYTSVTYFFLVILFIIFSYLCEKDYLIFNVNIIQIDPEEIISLKYVEHITIYFLIIISILVFLGILTLFDEFVYTSGIILSLISIKFLIKSLVAILSPAFDEKVSNKIWVLNSKMELEISLSKIIYYSISFIVFILWLLFFNNFILNNFIAFSITYLVVKKFEFRNFYFILFLYVLVLVYNFIWIYYNGIKIGVYFNLTTESFINIPIRFLLPELTSSPFKIPYFFSILDLILVGFLIEFLKKTELNNKYLLYGRRGLYSGLLLNLCSFYLFSVYFPFFIFPGFCIITTTVVFSICSNEFVYFSHLDKQYKYLQRKINKEYPLQIIGADKSEDYNEMIIALGYIPPQIIDETEGNIEESPKTNKNTTEELKISDIDKL